MEGAETVEIAVTPSTAAPAPVRTGRPWTTILATVLTVIAALSAAGGAALMLLHSALGAELQRRKGTQGWDLGGTTVSVDQMEGLGVVMAGGVGVVAMVLLILAVGVFRGRRWPRGFGFVALLLAIVAAVALAGASAGTDVPAYEVAGTCTVLCLIAALILIWMPSARAFSATRTL